jgi:hypothetical protein
MAPERDYNAERLARIELLMAEARQALATIHLDPSASECLRARLNEALEELGVVGNLERSSHSLTRCSSADTR